MLILDECVSDRDIESSSLSEADCSIVILEEGDCDTVSSLVGVSVLVPIC